MSPVSSKDVVALRQKTGLGMMDCKRALEAVEGDFEKAVDYLRTKGIAKGEARSGRSMGEGLVESYIHPGGRIGVLLEIACETDFVSRSDIFKEMVHHIAMHIAAAAPLYVNQKDVPQDKIDREMNIYREQILAENKPANLVDKIAEGKLKKFFKENCLEEQPFIIDADKTIKDVVLEAVSRLKENINIRRFSRFALGD
jgi:elongation factor Ts